MTEMPFKTRTKPKTNLVLILTLLELGHPEHQSNVISFCTVDKQTRVSHLNISELIKDTCKREGGQAF